MSPVIRISPDVYSRLEQYAEGFDTPANVIKRLLDHYEGTSPMSPGTEPVKRENPVRGSAGKRIFTNREIQEKISNVSRRLSEAELVQLCNKRRSKEIFDINFPLFIKVPKNSSDATKRAAVIDDTGMNRWTWKFEFEKGEYLYAITTQWYERSDIKVKAWLSKHGEPPTSNVEA
jgi:hypothetical protein